MKKMRKFIPAVAMLLVSAVMLSTATYAWFTMGTYATATGMQVTATTSSALLIVDGDKDSNTYTSFKNAVNEITFERTNQTALVPAAAFDQAKHGEVDADENGLVTLNSFDSVNGVTGMAPADAVYTDAVENTHYVEYVMYIASGAAPLSATGATLCATVTYLPAEFKYIDNALAIQFDVYPSSKEATVTTGTVSFSQKDSNSTDMIIDLGVETVPSAFGGENYSELGDYVKVIMKVYYDGEMVDESITSESTTYIRNEKMIDLSATGFNVKFDYQTAPESAISIADAAE